MAAARVQMGRGRYYCNEAAGGSDWLLGIIRSRRYYIIYLHVQVIPAGSTFNLYTPNFSITTVNSIICII